MSITKLEKFLINRGLLEKFEKNVRDFGENPKSFIKEYTNSIDAIDKAFSWFQSPEGNDFWDGISNEWVTTLITNEL